MKILRNFRLGYEEYRVALTYRTIFQKYDDDMETWRSVLWFDSLASAGDKNGWVGDFSKIDDFWVFVWADGSQTECEPHDEDFAGLLDSQIQIFKEWLVK